MYGRASHPSESPRPSYDIAELDTFCEQLGQQLYELALNESFKGNIENFNAAIKLDLSSYDHLMAIIANYGETSTDIKEVNAKLQKHIKACLKSGIIHLPGDKSERDQVTKVIGNYLRLQLRIAQFKYFYLNYTQQNSEYNKEQSLLALKEIRNILPKIIQRTTEAGTAKHSFSLFGVNIPKLYLNEASKLRETHSKIETECTKLLAFIHEVVPENPQNVIPAATIAANAIKSPSTIKAKKRIISDDEMCKNAEDAILSLEKKQAVTPDEFADNSEKNHTMSPMMENAIDARLNQLKCKDDMNKLFTSLDSITQENKKAIETERAQQASLAQKYVTDQHDAQQAFEKQQADSHQKMPSLIQSLKAKLTTLIGFLSKIAKIIIIAVLDKLSREFNYIKNHINHKELAKSVHDNKPYSMAKTVKRLAQHGGEEKYDSPTTLIAHVIKNTLERDNTLAKNNATPITEANNAPTIKAY